MEIDKRKFGTLPDGREVLLFRVTNSKGAFVEMINYGATWVSAVFPDKKGNFRDVLLGFPGLEGYLNDSSYMGSTIGRFANRIGFAGFSISGKHYRLEANDGLHNNHGGYSGLHKKLWKAQVINSGVCFTVNSPDMEGGFPGNVIIEVRFTFTEDNKLTIGYSGKTDSATYLNLTNHAYFNLSDSTNVFNHVLQVHSQAILDTTSEYIPTGSAAIVTNTPFDFTNPSKIGKRIFEPNQQLIWNKGYNHCYILKDASSQELVLAASLTDHESGRKLEVRTSYPSVLLYTGNYLQSKSQGKTGQYYSAYKGLCLETQYFPDTPNNPHFPSCLFYPGVDLRHSTQYTFF